MALVIGLAAPALAQPPADPAAAINDLTNAATRAIAAGDFRTAEPPLRRAVEAARTAGLTDTAVGRNAQDALGKVLAETGRFAEAEALLRPLWTFRRQTLGDAASATLGTGKELAIVLDGLGRRQEALEIQRLDFAGAQATFGANQPPTLNMQDDLTATLRNLELYSEAGLHPLK